MKVKDRVDCIFQLLGQSGRWKQLVVQHFEDAIKETERPLFNDRDEIEAGIEVKKSDGEHETGLEAESANDSGRGRTRTHEEASSSSSRIIP